MSISCPDEFAAQTVVKKFYFYTILQRKSNYFIEFLHFRFVELYTTGDFPDR